MVCPSGCQRKTPFLGRGQRPCPRRGWLRDPVALPPVNGKCAMLQNLNEEFRECLVHTAECGRVSKTAFTPCGIKDYLDMDQRWLVEPAAMSLLSDYRISPSRSAGASRTRNSPPPARGSGPHFST
jgi:hypothetical protein